jgi:hypothetical protein
MLASTDAMQEIVKVYAELLAEHGAAFKGARQVLPTGEFFPDQIDISPDGLRTLFLRVLSHTPVPQDVPFELGFVEEESASTNSCSSGACGPEGAALLPAVAEQEDLYVIPLQVQVVRNPTRLTTSLARSAGGLLLAYADARVTGARAEIAATAAGLGVLLLNGSHMYMKGCGSVKLHLGTDLRVEEIAFAHALFVALTEGSARAARKSLQPTQDEAFSASLDFLRGQPELLRKLQEAPELLVSGAFEFEGKKGLFGSLFGGKKTEDVALKRKPRTPEEEARLLEARQLIEEAGLFGGE